MRKVILFSLLVLSSFQSKAQDPLSFEKVITVDSVGKDKIYSVIKEWFALNGNSKEALEVDDRSTGVIVANLSTEYFKSGFWYTSYTGYIFYKINIQVKDGRFKVTVTNFEHDTKVKSVSRLGIITSGEYDKVSINKSIDIKVWDDLKIKSNDIAEKTFIQFEKLKFKSDNW